MAAQRNHLTSEQLREIRTTAIEHMADISLHRRLTLPSNPKAGRSNPLKVTFADVGAKPSGGQVPDPPVLLIASAMSGGRLHAAWIGELAKSYGVRVVCIDKPGMGGSDPVPIEQQTPLWLEVVPFVLDNLKIKYVSLACHSAGAIYSANVLLHLRHLLDPVHPYVAFLAPWVSPRHTSSVTMLMASVLPAFLIREWPSIADFIAEKGVPLVDAIFGLLHRLNPRKKRNILEPPNTESFEQSSVNIDEIYNEAYRDRLFNLAFTYSGAEACTCLGTEAVFCLKGSRSQLWGDWKDYDKLVKLLVPAEMSLPEDAKLKIDVFHAAEDEMVGRRGQKWFDSCWSQEVIGKHIQYNSTVISDTDHNNIADESAQVFNTILGKISDAAQATDENGSHVSD